MKDDRVYLLHILEAIDKIMAYTSNEDEFAGDPKTQDAVIRNLEIIGEASKHLSSETTKKNPSIPWKRITGMRNKVIHEYFGVNLRVVWAVVEEELPKLKKQIEKVLTRHSR